MCQIVINNLFFFLFLLHIDSKFFKKQQERELEIRRKALEKYQMFERNFSQAQIAKAESLVMNRLCLFYLFYFSSHNQTDGLK